jgi:hypothetical protein
MVQLVRFVGAWCVEFENFWSANGRLRFNIPTVRANKCADLLANKRCDSGGPLIYYEFCSTPLNLLFLAAIMGVATPRLITL